jgi:hypothetical protein
MKKFFNTAGPCNPADHYMVDPMSRCQDLLGLIDQKSYFVIHAPRQSGKTTLLETLAQKLSAEGKYAAMRVSCEVGQPFRDDFAGVELVLLDEIAIAAKLKLSPDLLPSLPWLAGTAGNQLKKGLGQWAEDCSKPLVLFLDEIDALTNLSLESVLRQIRSGFSDRPNAFPHSIVLCGLRDVRDYKIAAGGSPTLGTASPFNIKTKSITFKEFDLADVQNLYLQHTTETGQQFEEGAIARAFELTAGQPWLVNALAREVVEEMKVAVNDIITIAHFDDAAQRLIQTRATHLDSLASKLNEDRVIRVLSPILASAVFLGDSTYNDDVSYVRDLGLIAPKDPLRIANPIYKEVIMRVLAERATPSIIFERLSFVTQEGALDVSVILSEFAVWWKRHAAVMLKGHVYHEVAAQIVFMAWLQRVVNGGGIIDREYGVGRGRIDILIRWPLPQSKNPSQWQQLAIELKAWAEGESDPLAEGLEQLERYLDGLGLSEGTLVIFDRRPDAKNSVERTSLSTTQTAKGYRVNLLRA